MATALIPVAGKLLGGAAQSIGGGIGGGLGGLIGGKKGKKIGKAIGGFGGKVLKGIFGFEEGGKVRKLPVRAFKKGGVVKQKRVRKSKK